MKARVRFVTAGNRSGYMVFDDDGDVIAEVRSTSTFDFATNRARNRARRIADGLNAGGRNAERELRRAS